jgi:hypothetical protein
VSVSKKYPVNGPCPCGSGKKYKKCHGDSRLQSKTPLLRAAESDVIELVAYTDESGNSGNHLFDKDQPDFWTATLVTPADFEAIAAPVVAECLKIVGKKELHGNALGLSGIDKIAPHLTQLIIETQSLFLFTKIEKMHLAGTKFADAVLDSGINQAMSLVQYGPPAARLPLALQLIQLLEEEDLIEWWQAFEKNDGAAFAAMMQKPLARLEEFHREGIYHDRTAQLLRDALTWGIAHPERLLEGGIDPLDSPNIVALTLIVAMLHGIHEATGARVTKFIHDEQNQFAKHLQLVHGHSKRFALDNSNICAPLPIVTSALTFSCELEVGTSRNCYGLQVVDTVLWLIKRFLESKGQVRGDARGLALHIIATGDITPFDRESMIRHVNNIWKRLQALPLTKQQMRKGKKLLAEFEANRIKRMNSPLED